MRNRKREPSEKNKPHVLSKLLRQHKWRCNWCQQQVVRAPSGIDQNKYKVPMNMATVDHIYDRNDIRRHLDNGQTKVLACFKCNQERRIYLTFTEWRFVEIIDIRDLLTVQK